MVNVNIRMDNDLKEQFADFCDNIGLSMSSLFNVFAKKVVKEKKVPFDLAYNEDMWKLIPDEWKVKDGNTFKLFVRDKMEDGFRNLYERLLFLEYIVKGELPK